MATQDASPSLIIGQQWSALADFFSSGTQNDEDEAEKDENKRSCDSMKLHKQDMGLFGYCPARDEFSLVVCETCGLLIKPQALKQHIESRHGPTNLSNLGSISVSALNSELGKKLLMALPMKPAKPPEAPTVFSDRRMSGTFKPLPTKASLKQVPASVRNISAPILGVKMKINPMESVKPRQRIVPAKSAPMASSNPVVKMEKLEKFSKTLSSTLSSSSLSLSSSSSLLASKLVAKQDDAIASQTVSSKHVQSLSPSEISFVNEPIKLAVSLSTPSSTPMSTCVPLVSTPVLLAVTKTSTDTPVTTRNVTTFVSTPSTVKSFMIAPMLAVGSAVSVCPTMAVSSRPVTTVPVCRVSNNNNTKVPKDQKERKYLQCKDREYNCDKHCGVMVTESGKHCTRSLTCKTHALSLRRTVPGRSKSFDILLKEHKAAKEAILKAKAESQNSASSANCVQVSPATISCGMKSLKHETATSVISQLDERVGNAASLSGVSRVSMSSSAMPSVTAQFAKPLSAANVFQRFTSSAILPAAITVKELSGTVAESSLRMPSSSSSTSPQVSRSSSQEARPDQNFIPHHPRPLACNQFGGRVCDRNHVLYSRRMDYVRAALLSALERQNNPPPHKKLCVESSLPKEFLVPNSGQDPYSFNIVDNCSVTGPSLVSPAKPSIKPKPKLSASPVAASSANLLSVSLSSGIAAASLPFSTSSSASSLTSLYATPVVVSSASPSSLGLTWAANSWDGLASRSPSASPSPAVPSIPVTNPGKRKRSGSSGALNSHQLAAAMTSGNGPSPVSPAVILPVSLGEVDSGGTNLSGTVPPSALSTHQSSSLIAIPGMTLTNASLGQLSTASLGTVKVTASGSGSAPGSAHKNNNIFKDFSLLLTGVDPNLVNGQYVNITGAQLTELTSGQGQALLLNNFAPGGTNSSTALSSVSSGIQQSSGHAPKPVKRSRGSGSKSHPGLVSSATKISVGSLEGFKFLPNSGVISSGCRPSTAVLMDGTMLTLAAGGTPPTLMAITPANASTVNSGVAGNPAQVLPVDQTSVQSSTPLVNGMVQPAFDKSGSSSSQRHHHSSSSKSHHHHHHHHHKTHHQQTMSLGSVLQASPSVAMPLPTATAAQFCSSQAILKNGGSFNLATKNSDGKLTMQPISLTFPISVSQAGLASLNSGKPQPLQQQSQQQQSHHTLLVTTTSGDMDPSSLLVAGKADIHLQPHLPNTSTSNLIS